MNQEIIHTDQAPEPVGPYSQAVRSGGFLFLAGQIPLDPASGEMVTGDIMVQTRQVLSNIIKVVQAGGATLADVVKTTIFLKDMGQFPAVNGVYAEFFSASKPARSCVEVSALPKDADIEIEAIVRLRQ